MSHPLSPTTKKILALPLTMSAAEVAKRAGTSESNVSRVRAMARKQSKGRKGAPAPASAPAPQRTTATRPAASEEGAFRRMVLDLGVARAKALVGDVERRLAAIVDGLARVSHNAVRLARIPDHFPSFAISKKGLFRG